MRRHAAGDLRHWSEERQGALRRSHRLVGDRSDARCHEFLGLGAVGCEMQISEKGLPASQLLTLYGQWLLHLYDQFSSTEYVIDKRRDFGSGCLIIGIREAQRFVISRSMSFNPHSPDDALIFATLTPIQI
jgi:hypothetical protein